MSEGEFTKLFKFVESINTKLDQQIENMATKADIQNVLDKLDSIEKQLEISKDERLMMGHQLDRLDRWTHELANKISYTLST